MGNYLRKIILSTFALLALSGIIAVIYANTLGSPFVFDDNANIVFNPSVILQDLSLKSVKSMIALNPNKLRFFPNITFGLNYYIGGFNVFGFHLVNIAIHITTAFIFYLLACSTLKLSPGFKGSERAQEIAFAAALLWAVHPLQSNAVTYIVQRMTSISTLFCLLCVYSYARARLARSAHAKAWLLGTAVLSGTVALFSKENSAMLPLMILGYEFFFLYRPQSWIRHKNKILAGIAVISILFALICWFYLNTNMTRLLHEYSNMNFTLGQRLLTEARVVLHYLSLLFLPLPSRLNLVYDFPISSGFIAPPQTMLAIFGLSGLASFVFLLFRRYRLASFAVFWFLLNLSIESSIIPLDIIYEHRMYMPSMFLILSATAWCYKIAGSRAAIARTTILAAVILLSIFTWQRNSTWKDEITLWTDVVEKAPESMRNNLNLGNVLTKAKKLPEAEYYLRKAITIGHNDKSGSFSQTLTLQYLERTHENLAYVYHDLNNYPKAIAEINLALKINPRRTDLFVTLGKYYAKMNQHKTAYDYFQKAASKGFKSVDLFNNWAVSSFQLGKIDQTIGLLKISINLDPEHPESHYNLGIAYGTKGMHDEAQKEMALSFRLRGNKRK